MELQRTDFNFNSLPYQSSSPIEGLANSNPNGIILIKSKGQPISEQANDEQPNFANLRMKAITIRSNILKEVQPQFKETNYWFTYNILLGDYLNGLIALSTYDSAKLIDHILASFCKPIRPSTNPEKGFLLVLTEGNLRKAIDMERQTKDDFYKQYQQGLSINLMSMVNGLIATSQADTTDIVDYISARYREQYLQLSNKRKNK